MARIRADSRAQGEAYKKVNPAISKKPTQHHVCEIFAFEL